jgi:hypothetical protein
VLLISQAAGFIDESQILEELDTLQETFAENPEALTKAIQSYIDRSLSYASIGLKANAIKVLYSITNMVVVELIESDATESVDKEVITTAITSLEEAWKKVLTDYVPEPKAPAAQPAPSKKRKSDEPQEDEDEDMEYDGVLIESPVTYEEVFSTLAQWRVQLQETFGPLFSDPLRVLKAMMVKAGKTKAGSDIGGAKKKQKK